MKKASIIGLFLTAIFTLTLLAGDTAQADKDTIKKIIIESYRDGLCNVGDTALVDKGFHPGFNLLIMKNDMLEKFPIYSWKQSVETRKKAGKFPPKEKYQFTFPQIDITETAAMAKVEFYQGKKLLFTDYLSLYKFNGGWKIVAKIYHKH
ncbi:MAG: nuclear transport factor 2 family protein [bacterium]|nr:nuclear transport factor 2 family protein [bacterium]